MSEPIDIDAITAKAKQERATIDQVWKYVDKAWEDALKAVAELATMYGIDPDILYVHDSEEKYAESRLYVADESYVPDYLHEDEEVVKRFTADANYLLNCPMFYGFFYRDSNFYNELKVVQEH